VVPYADPETLVERDLDELSSSVYTSGTAELRALLGELHTLLQPKGELAGVVTRALPQAGAWRMLLAMLPDLFDPAAVLRALDTELRYGDLSGTALLDGWVRVPPGQRAGPTAVLAGHVLRNQDGRMERPSSVRAVPTRQLHLTSANSPMACAVSVLRVLATKGAATVKASIEQAGVAVLLSLALRRLAMSFPAARHLSLVYWRGGDRTVEDALLADGSYDRVVVWGGAEATRSVRVRTTIRTLTFEPRVGMSLIGREASDSLEVAAARAAIDSLIEDQAACSSSLVHYVEADRDGALRYCRALHEVLSRWDAAMPARPSAASRAALWRLRREDLVGGTWFTNGTWPDIASSVAYSPHPIDLSAHPAGRCVVVRRVDRLEDALRYLDHSVSTVGVYPDQRWAELRDRLAARGITTVAPLGQAERFWPGMPHDGMRVLGDLVSWAVS